MSKYVITVTADVDGATEAAQTTIRVDLSSGQTRVTDLTVRSASGRGLAPADLPPLDLDLLVRALAAATPPPLAVAPAPPSPEPVEQVTPAPRRRGRKTAARKAPAKATKSAAKKATKRAAENVGTRAYRRMPEPEQVMDVYHQTGSITAVAEHFGVPRHTVAGWARRLRTLGHAIGRS